MVCSKCGQAMPDENSFCTMCGAPLQPAKKGRLWPAFLVLALIAVFGFGAFLLIRPAALPVQDAAAPWFSVSDGVLYFDQDLYTGSEQLTVPETVGGQTVTAISDRCFADCTELIIIHLPETVTSIGDSAFSGCSNLRGIKLPESLTTIGDSAFSQCIRLEAVCIPYSLKNIGDNLFSHCHSLSYFYYPGPLAEWYDLPFGQLPEDSSVYCADGIHPAA